MIKNMEVNLCNTESLNQHPHLHATLKHLFVVNIDKHDMQELLYQERRQQPKSINVT